MEGGGGGGSGGGGVVAAAGCVCSSKTWFGRTANKFAQLTASSKGDTGASLDADNLTVASRLMAESYGAFFDACGDFFRRTQLRLMLMFLPPLPPPTLFFLTPASSHRPPLPSVYVRCGRHGHGRAQ